MDSEGQFVVTEDGATDDRSVTTQPEVKENGALSASASQVSAPEVLDAGAGVANVDVEAAGATGSGLIIEGIRVNISRPCLLTCLLAFSLEVPDERVGYTGTELDGKSLAVIGLGKVGREVALRMKLLGMKVFSYDPNVPVDAYGDVYGVRMELSEIWPIVDYITLHMPLVEGTRNFIDASVFNQCKKGVKIINVSDGGLINMCDLKDALLSGQVEAASLDSDPVTLDILNHPDVSAEPFIGPEIKEAQVNRHNG